MPVRFAPKQGSVVRVDFDRAFREPEMVKPRPCVVISKPSKARPGLCTIVPLSTTAPRTVMPWHMLLQIPFELPSHWAREAWVKGDMIQTVAWHRMDLLRIGKDRSGRRIYQTETLPAQELRAVQACVLEGLNLSRLTGYL